MGVVFLLMLPLLPVLQYSKRPQSTVVPQLNRSGFPGAAELEPEAGQGVREEERHLVLH